MIYRSNLICPDLSSYFKLHSPPLQILGHDIPSDPDFDPHCGFLSHDEAAILYHCAKTLPGLWADLGARFGWSTAHLEIGGATVVPVDQGASDPCFRARFDSNLRFISNDVMRPQEIPHSSSWFLQTNRLRFHGAMIDACHDAPAPLQDAQGCARLAQDTAVIVLHDFQGLPVRDAVRWLLDNDWHCRVYWTPNQMAACWRGDFRPPAHVPDPMINWGQIRAQMRDFDFSRCE